MFAVVYPLQMRSVELRDALGVQEQLVKETADLAGITKRVTPHLLRHSVATTLLEHGIPLEQIQKFLGHAKIDTT